MVARSLAKAKEGVRISYAAQKDSGNIQQVLIFQTECGLV